MYWHTPYGIRWNTATDVKTEVMVHRKQIVEQSYYRYPVQEGMGRCVLHHTTGELNYLLHPTQGLKKLDGSDADLTGADGQVMVRTPRFYFLIFTDGDNKYFLIGLQPFDVYAPLGGTLQTSAIHPWFLEGGGNAPYKYISAFEGVLKRGGSYVDGTGLQTGTSGDLIHSVYGFTPLTYFHLTERRTYSVDGVFHQLPFWANEALILLFLTEFKTWNSQTAIPGYTEGGTWDFAKVCKTGITASLGNVSGSVLWQNAPDGLRCSFDQTGKYVANSFRGIENFFGHVWKWIDGININYIGAPLTEAPIYLSNNPSQWTSDTATNYTDTGLDMPLVSGYQRNLYDGSLLPNNVVGGSSTTFLTDYFYASAGAGWRGLLSGGELSYGATAGVACRLASSAASGRAATIGGRVAA